MANRIIFEDEIEEHNANISDGQKRNSVQNVPMHLESSTGEGNAEITDNNLGNTEQDKITSSHLNDTQQTEKGISYEILEIDDSISNFNEINEGDTDPSNETGGKNTNEDIQMVKGKNEQDIDRTEINCDKSNEMGNPDQISLENSHEVPVINQIEESRGTENLGQDKVRVKMCQSPISEEGKSHHAAVKRRLKKELELLGADLKSDDVEGKFDVFGDDSQVYRKYKLRKTERKFSYKEPSDWKPERRVSSADTGPISLECSVCYLEFDSKKALHSHQRHHITVSEYTCSLCSQKFKQNADLIAHKSIHNSESFLCKQCKVAFSDHCDYLHHKLTHTTQSEFTCPECGLKYNRTSYKLHIWTHYNKKFNCHMCSYVGNGESNLQSHINQRHIHTKTCVECGRVFHNRHNLEYHMMSHTGVKKIQCFYCGKCFCNISARKLHTRVHTGEKPYTCDICGHKTAQSNDLKLHKITHETEKKYSCDLCPKKYFYKSYLVIHMRSHTQESLYECPECDGKFVNPSGLKTHYMFKHLSERPVECSVCNKHFINNNQYKKHTRSKYHKRNMYGHVNNEKGSA